MFKGWPQLIRNAQKAQLQTALYNLYLLWQNKKYYAK